MNILTFPTNDVDVVGLQVKQIACPTTVPECKKFVGRVSVVDSAFYDENNTMHVHTVDGIWCPSTLLEVVES